MLVEQALVRSFRSRFAGLVLAIEPAADPDELRAAVRAGQVDRIRLSLTAPAGASTPADAEKWLAAGTGARFGFELAAVPGSGRLRTDLLVRHLEGDTAAFEELAQFAGIAFSEVRVGVVLPDGGRRSFDLAKLETGRAPARPLDGIELDAEGRPTDASLRQALAAVLEPVAASPLREPRMLER